MRFSELTSQISDKIGFKTLQCMDSSEILDIALIDGSQSEYIQTTIYFGYVSQLGSVLPAQCVLAQDSPFTPPENFRGNMALTVPANLFRLFNAARQLVNRSGEREFYAELTDCAAHSRSIDPVINLAASKLGNSLVLLDRDFKVLAHSTVFPIDDPLWEQNIRQGYCSYEFVSAVQKIDTVKSAPLTPDPVVVTCYASPLRKLSSKIFINGKWIGILLMLEKETPINVSHMELLPAVSAVSGDVISRYAPYLIPGNTAYQKLLYDLLIGAPAAEMALRIAALRFSPRLCALCLRPSRYLGQKHLKEQVAAKLEKLLPGTRYTFHENGIAALVPLENAPELNAEQMDALRVLAQNEFLRIGISNTFFNVENFAHRYRQARQALDLSHRLDPGTAVCRYADCAFYDLLDCCGDPSGLGLFCHPALSILNRYDRENGTDLYHTLRIYLECGGSIKDTAGKLFIHRNSLNYRLARIRELTQANPNDSNTRFLLTMSFRIDHFIGRDS